MMLYAELPGRRARQLLADVVVLLWIALWCRLGVALFRYLPGRVRWIRQATAARGLVAASSDLHLFALRAVASRPLAELRRVEPDPMAAMASGDFVRLAELELRAMGLRTGEREPQRVP